MISNIKDDDKISRIILFLLFFSLSGVLLYLVGLRVDAYVQGWLTLFCLATLFLLKFFKKHSFVRVLFICFTSYLVLRYFFWRVNYTLSYQDFWSFIGAIVLFLAELYGIAMFFLSAFVNIRPLYRTSVPLPADKSLWPTVDVIIPSYDEPVELVKITLAAATNIDYPSDKLNLYLLDDGGTKQKLQSSDSEVRQAAHQRVKEFKQLCESLNINYLSRDENVNAKAGNMNAALEHISGDLILVLDADHAPTADILTRTVSSFLQDERIFLVQTPHFFINPDPIEKNLDLFQKMPSENLMFYRRIQRGLDFWQASFFCGSAAVLKRKAIDEVGGFSGMTITEDSETALKLHSLGWKSHYIFYPMIAGLQPETFASFMIQRMRWAQGMVQNFILNNPFKMPGLAIEQRLSYLSNMVFWFFPFARLIFLIAPSLYLCFDLKIYNANISEFITYTVPYILALMFNAHFLFGKERWILVSEIYETMQSLFSVRAVWSVLKNPYQPKFSVTPKMETLDKDFISPLSRPFYIMIIIAIVTVVVGIIKFWINVDHRGLIGITLFWAIFNLLTLMAALGALYEHRQRRTTPRIPVNIQAFWVVKSAGKDIKRIPVFIRDMSMGGVSLIAECELPPVSQGQYAFIEIESLQGIEYYKAEVVTTIKQEGHIMYGIKFQYDTLREYVEVVRFVHGDSSRWVAIEEGISHDVGLITPIFIMTRTGVYYGLNHIKKIFVTYFWNRRYEKIN